MRLVGDWPSTRRSTLPNVHELPLVSIPTAISVDAFFTWATGVRQDGCVKYLETKPPDCVVIDFDVLAEAPREIRAAGICDVLSIATGSADWEYAHQHELNPPGIDYSPTVTDMAQTILQHALDAAESAGRGEPQGLRVPSRPSSWKSSCAISSGTAGRKREASITSPIVPSSFRSGAFTR